VLCVVFTLLSLRRHQALRIGVHHWFLKMFGKLIAQFPVVKCLIYSKLLLQGFVSSFSFPSSLPFFSSSAFFFFFLFRF
jgi:hypothetical protein